MLELGMMVNNDDNDNIKTMLRYRRQWPVLENCIKNSLPLLFGFSRDDNWLIQFMLRDVMYASNVSAKLLHQHWKWVSWYLLKLDTDME